MRSLDPHLLQDLYKHQQDALRHLLLNNVANYALFWQMGCGKGVLAVRYGTALPAASGRLCCCPASCKVQVAREIRRFGPPGVRVQILNGRQAQLEPDVDWHVVNYELLLSDAVFEQLISRHWSLLILDESHLLRSMAARRTVRALGRTGLATKADRVLAMTGTPIVNSPLDVYALTARLFPAAIGSMRAREFEDRYCAHRVVHIGGGRTVEQIVGGKNLAELRERLAPHMSRLRRDEVLDLPPIAIHDFALTVEIGDALDAAMVELPSGLVEALQRADDDTLMHLVQRHAVELATLRRLFGTLKAGAAAEHILERLAGGEDRVIAFFHHRDVGDIVLKELHQARVAASMIRGDTPAGARWRAVDALTDGELRVLLLQNESGSLGLNLQACRYAAIIEPSWTDATTQQAISRIYRAGQTRNCIVEFLLIPDSIDEHIVSVARRKAAIAADLIEKSAA